jgi:putative ABC transport system permease protein
MILTLAIRNLFHDRTRFAVTLVGILFAVVLIAVQLGLYLGARQMIIGMIDHAKGDLWISRYGASSFEQAPLLTGRERFAALSVPGVESVSPLVVTFSEWRKNDGSTTNVVLIGADADGRGLEPWNIVEGSNAATFSPDGVLADRTYANALGISGVGATAEIDGKRVRVDGLTDGIRSFTTSPYIFASLNKVRSLLSISADQATFYLVKLAPGANAASVQAQIASKLSGVSVFTKEEFLQRNLDYWLFGTGAGVALLGGAALGLLIGTVIVAQTLYSSTKDHLSEFATLRALGSSSSYIHKVILTQAGFSAVLGYALGMTISLIAVAFSGGTALPVLITSQLAALLFLLTLGMCAVSAVSSIYKVTKIDPAIVFGR